MNIDFIEVCYFLIMVCDGMRQWLIRNGIALIFWLPPVAFSTWTLLQGRVFFYPDNFACIQACITNSLNQNQEIPTVLAENAELKRELSITARKMLTLQWHYGRARVEQAKTLRKLKKATNEESILERNLTELNQNFSTLNDSLTNATEENNKVTIYESVLRLREILADRIQAIELCDEQLNKYCHLKDKGDSRNIDETNKMLRYLKYLGCKEDQLSEKHCANMQPMFNKVLYTVMQASNDLTELIISGDYEKMKIALKGQQNLPSDNCQFLCNFESNEEATDGNNAPSFGYGAFYTAWNAFGKVLAEYI